MYCLTMKSYSQLGQDVFVYKMLIEGNEPYDGTYIDLACNEPFHNNNTIALEKYFGWKGCCIDIEDYADKFTSRTAKFLQLDATAPDFFDILVAKSNINCELVDYLSFDLDSAGLDVIMKFPFDKMKFKVMTVEHDKHVYGQHTQDEMQRIIQSHGYKLITQNVYLGSCFIEDWYIHPEYVSEERFAPFVLNKLNAERRYNEDDPIGYYNNLLDLK